MKFFFVIAFIFFSVCCPAKTLEDLRLAKEKARIFLLNQQLPNGAWGDATRTKSLNIYAPGQMAHRSFQASCTSLCVMALAEEKEHEGVKSSLGRASTYLLDSSRVVRRPATQWLGNVWGHAYMIQAFLKLRTIFPERKTELDEAIEQQIEMLKTYAFLNGGWGYYNFKNIGQSIIPTRIPSGESASFITATCLISLKKAKDAGFAIPPLMLKKALITLRRLMNPDLTFQYSESYKYAPKTSINKKEGSVARNSGCLLALYHWKSPKAQKPQLNKVVKDFVRFERWLEHGRKKPVPHESTFAIAGYFYYFGHYYASQALLQTDAKQREHAEKLAHIIISKQESNGAWFDYPIYNYGHFYGTPYALMSLQSSERVLRK